MGDGFSRTSNRQATVNESYTVTGGSVIIRNQGGSKIAAPINIGITGEQLNQFVSSQGTIYANQIANGYKSLSQSLDSLRTVATAGIKQSAIVAGGDATTIATDESNSLLSNNGMILIAIATLAYMMLAKD